MDKIKMLDQGKEKIYQSNWTKCMPYLCRYCVSTNANLRRHLENLHPYVHMSEIEKLQ